MTLLVPLCLGVFSGRALAADTTEPLDLGFSDFEFYLTRAGLGSAGADQMVAGEMILGVGLTSRVYGYLATVLAADSHLASSSTDLGCGLYASARDGQHFDLDFMFDLAAPTSADGPLSLRPSCEINWDACPDLASYGIYSRLGTTFYGEELDDRSRRLTDLDLTLGAYWTLSPKKHLLLEYLVVKRDEAVSDGNWDGDSVALGLNVLVIDSLELINQISFTLPEDGEDSTVGLMVGIISTLP